MMVNVCHVLVFKIIRVFLGNCTEELMYLGDV